MSRIYLPAQSAEDWQQLLAEPEKQWKPGFSARAFAYCWQEADGFPFEIRRIFRGTVLDGLWMLLGFPEHQVPLPGGKRPSQSDLWVLARKDEELVSIAVEGKVSEPFGPTIGEWYKDASKGKMERLAYLQEQLGLSGPPPLGTRYQLLHRTASAVIEARRFSARHAVMLVHSFSQTNEWFDDFRFFVNLFGKKADIGRLVTVGEVEGVSLHLGWCKGEEKYLTV